MQKGRQYKGACPLVRTDISYNPVDTTLGTPIYLPTAEPATDDFSYTVAAGHLPDIIGTPLGKYTLCAAVVQAGKSEAAVLRNISYRFLVNDASKTTGSFNANAGVNWTWTHFDTFDIKVGDKVSCRAWSTDQASDVYWNFQGMYVFLTRPFLYKDHLIKDLSMGSSTCKLPGLTTPSSMNSSVFVSFTTPTSFSFGSVFTLYFLPHHPTYGIFRAGRGDNTVASIAFSSSTTTGMSVCAIPSYITYRLVGDL